MFGDKPIFGQTELKIDEKGRMFIPANTNREVGEELVLLSNKNLNLYEIYSIAKLKEKFEELNELMINSKNKSHRNHYEKMIYELSKSILKSGKVDSQGRIITGKVFEDYENVLSTGAYDHLIIEPIKSK